MNDAQLLKQLTVVVDDLMHHTTTIPPGEYAEAVLGTIRKAGRLIPPGTPRYDPLIGAAAEPLAIAVLRLVDRNVLDSRSPAADALMSWADMRFRVMDGSGIAKLRALAETLP